MNFGSQPALQATNQAVQGKLWVHPKCLRVSLTDSNLNPSDHILYAVTQAQET